MEKKILLVIKEESSRRAVIRIIGVMALIYLIVNLKDNPAIFEVAIGLILLYLLILDQSYTIKSDGDKIFISYSNVLRILPEKQIIRFSDLARVEFIPAEFSTTIFLLNAILRSGSRSYKKSILKFYKKDGEIIELENIGSKEEISQLQQWLNEVN